MTVLGESSGGTVIERATVGREDREGLVDRVLLEKRRKQQLVLLYIVDLQVGGGIKDLDTVAVSIVEQLTRGIGGIGNIAA